MTILFIIIWAIIGMAAAFLAWKRLHPDRLTLEDLIFILLNGIVGPIAWILFFWAFGSDTILWRRKK